MNVWPRLCKLGIHWKVLQFSHSCPSCLHGQLLATNVLTRGSSLTVFSHRSTKWLVSKSYILYSMSSSLFTFSRLLQNLHSHPQLRLTVKNCRRPDEHHIFLGFLKPNYSCYILKNMKYGLLTVDIAECTLSGERINVRTAPSSSPSKSFIVNQTNCYIPRLRIKRVEMIFQGFELVLKRMHKIKKSIRLHDRSHSKI
jgi:hypothetical protein